MKSIVFSTAAILSVVVSVILGSVFLSRTLAEFEVGVEEILAKNGESYDEIKALYRDFKKKECFLSLLTGDEALAEIENGFIEAISYGEVGNGEEMRNALARLANDIENVRKLSELSVMSVF